MNQKLTKKDLLFISQNPKSPHAQILAHRTEKIQKAYDAKKEYLNVFKSTPRYKTELEKSIMESVFETLSVESPTTPGKIFKAHLSVNQYPYNLEKGLLHFNIWNLATSQRIPDYVIQKAIEIITKQLDLKDGFFAVWWAWKGLGVKSVPEFPHIHLIIEK